MPQFESDHAIDTELTTSSAAVGTSSNPEQQQSIPAVQTATTFNQVLNEERKQNEATQDEQQVEERNTDNEAGAVHDTRDIESICMWSSIKLTASILTTYNIGDVCTIAVTASSLLVI